MTTRRDSALIGRLAAWVNRILVPYHRARVSGLDRIPSGPALYVGNHNGGTLSIDTFLLGAAIHRERGIEDVPYGLAHDLVIDVWPLGRILPPLGAVRASHSEAQRLFDEGCKVLVYPGGEIEALRPFAERNLVKFGGRRGYVRMAMRSGVPIIPVVAAGAHSTFIVVREFDKIARALGADRALRLTKWPLIFSLPWGFTLGPSMPYLPLPARITIEVLDPVHVDGNPDDEEQVARIANQVESQMQAVLSRLTS